MLCLHQDGCQDSRRLLQGPRHTPSRLCGHHIEQECSGVTPTCLRFLSTSPHPGAWLWWFNPFSEILLMSNSIYLLLYRKNTKPKKCFKAKKKFVFGRKACSCLIIHSFQILLFMKSTLCSFRFVCFFTLGTQVTITVTIIIMMMMIIFKKQQLFSSRQRTVGFRPLV